MVDSRGRGRTLMHDASCLGDDKIEAMIRFLYNACVAAGHERILEIANCEGLTPLASACSYQRKKAIEILSSYRVRWIGGRREVFIQE